MISQWICCSPLKFSCFFHSMKKITICCIYFFHLIFFPIEVKVWITIYHMLDTIVINTYYQIYNVLVRSLTLFEWVNRFSKLKQINYRNDRVNALTNTIRCGNNELYPNWYFLWFMYLFQYFRIKHEQRTYVRIYHSSPFSIDMS